MTLSFDLPLFDPIFSAIEEGERLIKINGLWGASEAFFLSRLLAKGIPFCLVTPSAPEAHRMLHEIRFFSEQTTSALPLSLFPGWDIFPNEPGAPRADWVAERLSLLYRLSLNEPVSIVTSIEGFLQKVLDRSFLIKQSKILKERDSLERDLFIEQLFQNAYEPVSSVTTAGEFVARGGIVDFFPPTSAHPIRVEFFGDTVSSLRTFDAATQKSIAPMESAVLIPGREDHRNPQYRAMTFSDYLSPETILIVDEPDAVSLKGTQFYQIVEETAMLAGKKNVTDLPVLPASHLFPTKSRHTMIHLESLSIGSNKNAKRFMLNVPALSTLGLGRFGQSFSDGIEKLNRLRSDHTLIIAVRNQIQLDRFKRIFDDYNLPYALWNKDVDLSFPAPVFLAIGEITEGFSLPEIKTIFLTDEILSGHAGKKKNSASKGISDDRTTFFASIDDLKIRDIVVHVDHGIGLYLGIKRLSIAPEEWRKDGKKLEADFLVLEYLGGDKLYVPLDALKRVQKYIGLEGGSPTLDRLGGGRWSRTKEKVKKAIDDMTEELLALYAEREVAKGHPFLPTAHIEEFAAAFPYEETPDQLTAISDIICDMQSEKPMDRLICGDVGYGKTEVAMRAAFLAAMDNKQVAVMVPTTLLAMQHGETFAKRFASFPVKTATLSRLTALKDQKETLANIKKGAIDIVIGTHRLLGKDIMFRDLGLVIIDEEHRFGVRHKERLKQLRKEVDILTLTATPIPRTLQMAVSKMRDMSVIETPPVNRLAIRTVVAPFDPKLIREVVFRELVRGGQIFFVHNRVQDITTVAEMLTTLIPEATIGIAHGQMREGELENVITKFLAKEYTLLVCTTIIESGLDIPSANTIIINNADRFGLAEIYQLRGRVGRSDEQAYAYLLVQEEAMITDTARQRLQALSEFSELGAGFHIAARDLEIRGAGSLLGSEQSGQVAAVGFSLYLEMIEERVQSFRGQTQAAEMETTVSLQCSAFIPEEYIADPHHRLTLYRRLTSAKTDNEITEIQSELLDRYGNIPEPLARLLETVTLKVLAHAARVIKVSQEEKGIAFWVDAAVPMKESIVNALLKKFKGKILFVTPFSFRLTMQDRSHEAIFCETLDCLTVLKG
ncbi:MAG: transcription-repair coupling factor [Nitrospirota bacterium]